MLELIKAHLLQGPEFLSDDGKSGRPFSGPETITMRPGLDRREFEPHLTLWEPEYRRIDDRFVVRQPPIVDEVRAHREAPLPDVHLVWRGFPPTGDSLGNVSFDSLAALGRAGFAKNVSYFPFGIDDDRPAFDFSREERFRVFSELSSRLRGDEAFEVQVPGYDAPMIHPCVRFFFEEFGGYVWKSELVEASDVLWVPSRHTERVMRRFFPEHPIVVVPHGVDTAIFHPADLETSPRREKFRFLFVGGTITRKGFDLVLKAFGAEQEQMPDAELVLKIMPNWAGFLARGDFENDDRIRVVRQTLSASELADLYRSCDVFVAPARAEGFGMCILEAMACGLPVIVPNGCAMDDFCPDEARYSVEADEVFGPFEQGGLTYVEPDLASLRAAMRRAYDDRADGVRRGRVGRSIAESYDWVTVTKMLIAKCTGVVRSLPNKPRAAAPSPK